LNKIKRLQETYQNKRAYH